MRQTPSSCQPPGQQRSTASTQQWQQWDSQHFSHPFTDHRALSQRGCRIIERGEGIYLWDSEGQRLLDAMAGLWCVNLGYGRDELARVAQQQMQQLAYCNSFFQCSHPAAIGLAKLLADLAPAHMNRVFFTNSGSESVDTALRLARCYWQWQDLPAKRLIIGRHNGYHGSTLAGATVGGMKAMHQQAGCDLADVVWINQPYWFGEGQPEDPNQFGERMALELQTTIEQVGEDKVAAFIAEPVQGAGGVIIPPSSYWPKVQEICDYYQILLIVDEVICGFGRTGQWFGSDYYQLTADLMTMAKGLSSGYLPIGGVMISDAIAGVMEQSGDEFYHGFTYSGHPVAAAVAQENLRLIQQEQLLQRVRDQTAPYLAQQWQTLVDQPLVGEARSVGLLAAIELVNGDTGGRYVPGGRAGQLCRDICFEEGLIMRAVGDTMVISPPLIISKPQIDELLNLVNRCLELTQQRIRQ